MKKRSLITAVVIIIAFLLSACGVSTSGKVNFTDKPTVAEHVEERPHPEKPVAEEPIEEKDGFAEPVEHGPAEEPVISVSEPDPTPVGTQKRPAAAYEVKEALADIGYIEETEFDERYYSIIESDGYNSRSVYETARADGIVGTMVDEGRINGLQGLRQYLLYSLSDIILQDDETLYTYGDFISYMSFSDESAAISAVEELMSEIEEPMTGENEDHYSHLSWQEGYDICIIGRIENTCIVFQGMTDTAALQVFDILGY